ncbi:uncharacterized protein LOC118507752 isoform X1 [Anopheles stephensi]|uniref:uncharacterized protein LOC118507752 isoform X1 n=1 Tax=Anopheles stephensi TaxID=30069 RepID=UPI001658ACB8|nr:uncharacterized protein LOC118507752 isoform X1 [Anopheles stephensi]
MHSVTRLQHQPFSMTCAAQSHPLTRKVCPVCDDQHYLANCVAFGKLSVAEREEVVKKEGLCFSCLRQNHRIRFCRSTTRCSQCNGRHHTMLCKGQQIPSQQHQLPMQPTNEDININAATRDESKLESTVWLSTAVVLVQNEQGVKHPARALIDQGSQSNFISERLAQQLKLRKKTMLKPLSGIGSVSVFANGMVSAQIKSRVSDYQTTLNFLVLPRVTADCPSRYSDVSRWNLPNEVVLADPLFFKPERIDLLIGAEVFGELLEQGRIALANHLPNLLQTKLGWIVCGKVSKRNVLSTGGEIAGCAIDEEFHSTVERLIKLEDIPEEKLPTP